MEACGVGAVFSLDAAVQTVECFLMAPSSDGKNAEIELDVDVVRRRTFGCQKFFLRAVQSTQLHVNAGERK